MDENKDEILAGQGASAEGEGTARLNGTPEPPEKSSPRLKKALLRAGAAFLAALLLLGITKLSALDLLRGAAEQDAVQDAELGAFVKRDIFAIIGFYADEKRGETVTARYALVPMAGEFVSVYFTKRYLESAETVYTETNNYIDGAVAGLDKYFTVQGTTEALPENVSTQMYEWFTANKDWMVEKGVIADVGDSAEYLSDTVLVVDAVNGLNETLVLVLTGLAGLCLLYFAVELILMGAGFYLDRPKKAKVGAAEEAEDAESAQEDAEQADNDAPTGDEKPQTQGEG